MTIFSFCEPSIPKLHRQLPPYLDNSYHLLSVEQSLNIKFRTLCNYRRLLITPQNNIHHDCMKRQHTQTRYSLQRLKNEQNLFKSPPNSNLRPMGHYHYGSIGYRNMAIARLGRPGTVQRNLSQGSLGNATTLSSITVQGCNPYLQGLGSPKAIKSVLRSTDKHNLLKKYSQKYIIPQIRTKRAQQSKKNKNSCYIDFMQKIQKQNLQAELPSIFDLIKIAPAVNNFIQSTPNYEDINLRILSCSNEQLISISGEILGRYGMADLGGKYMLNKLVKEIQGGYLCVSYHNFSHGFSLMHMLYQLMKLDRNFKALFTKEEIGFALLAALGHDLGHMGTNNMFEIKIDSELATIANKQSVLQKMHIRSLFSIMKTKNINILDRSRNPNKTKQLITRLILATDVAKHFKGLQKLKQLHSSGQFDPKTEQHRYILLQQAFHACDIGNPCLQYDQYLNWSALLSYQFNTQTKLQQSHNVEVTQMMRYKGRRQFYEGQIGFINGLVFPLWKELAQQWGGFGVYLGNVEGNRERLRGEVEREQREEREREQRDREQRERKQGQEIGNKDEGVDGKKQ